MPPGDPTGISTSGTLQTVQQVGDKALVGYFNALPWFEVLSAIFSTACIAVGIYFFIKTGLIRNRLDRFQDIIMKKDSTKIHIRSSWDNIEHHFFSGTDNDLRIAIIEADTLLDEALRGAGVHGTQLGDRLKNVRGEQLPNIEDVWQAHKLRNRIAHEPNFSMKRDMAEKALTVYETALTHLGFLEPGASLTDPGSAGSTS